MAVEIPVWWKRKTPLLRCVSRGVYPDVTLKMARERRDNARKLLADNIDPSENRKARKAARAEWEENSFEVIAREWYAKHSANWTAFISLSCTWSIFTELIDCDLSP